MKEISVRLCIENERDLLAEYGLASVYINSVDCALGQLILFKQKLEPSEVVINGKKLGRTTLGEKIELAKELVKKGIIEQNLLNELVVLNEKRNILDHSVIGEGVELSDTQQKTGIYIAIKGIKSQDLNKDFLIEVTNQARLLLKRLMTALVKDTNYIGPLK